MRFIKGSVFREILLKHYASALETQVKKLESEVGRLKTERALSVQAEPVAWLVYYSDMPELGSYFSRSPIDEGICRSKPLYTHQPTDITAKLERNGLVAAAASELLEALEASQHGLHTTPDGSDCLCGQCRFVRLRDAALAKAKGKS